MRPRYSETNTADAALSFAVTSSTTATLSGAWCAFFSDMCITSSRCNSGCSHCSANTIEERVPISQTGENGTNFEGMHLGWRLGSHYPHGGGPTVFGENRVWISDNARGDRPNRYRHACARVTATGVGLDANTTKTAVPGGTRLCHRNGRSCVGSATASTRITPRLTERQHHARKSRKCHAHANPERGRQVTERHRSTGGWGSPHLESAGCPHGCGPAFLDDEGMQTGLSTHPAVISPTTPP